MESHDHSRLEGTRNRNKEIVYVVLTQCGIESRYIKENENIYERNMHISSSKEIVNWHESNSPCSSNNIISISGLNFSL